MDVIDRLYFDNGMKHILVEIQIANDLGKCGVDFVVHLA